MEILTHLHQYVPSVSYQRQVKLVTGEIVTEERSQILVGNDQLTAARIRGAQKAMNPKRDWKGLFPLPKIGTQRLIFGGYVLNIVIIIKTIFRLFGGIISLLSLPLSMAQFYQL